MPKKKGRIKRQRILKSRQDWDRAAQLTENILANGEVPDEVRSLLQGFADSRKFVAKSDG